MSAQETTSKDETSTSNLRPFHFAVPVHNLEAAKNFYGGVLGFTEGRGSTHNQDYNFFGSQVVIHYVGDDYMG